MRKITIPATIKMPVSVIDPMATGPALDVTFFDWLTHTLDSYEPLGQGNEMIRKSINIHSILQSAKDGDGTATYEDSDFEIIEKAVQQMKWKSGYARRVISFYDAISNSEKVKTPQGKPATGKTLKEVIEEK